MGGKPLSVAARLIRRNVFLQNEDKEEATEDEEVNDGEGRSLLQSMGPI